MSDPSPSTAGAASTPPAPPPARPEAAPSSVYLVAYPKVVFLYPVFLASGLAALYMSFSDRVLDRSHTGAAIVCALFLIVLAVNLVILAFDFPRTTSLTLFFFAVAVVTGWRCCLR